MILAHHEVPVPQTLPESRLYTFIDEPREYALYFLEGQKLIQELALVHPIQGPGFAYFRETVLSVQPMIALLKGGEQIGFYLDSDKPDFRLKIETGHVGATRCMLLPENFSKFPAKMHGFARVLKLFPNNRPPYESVIQIDGLALRQVVNRVLTDSYQVNCAIEISDASDQSLMLHQLPMLEGRDESPGAVKERRDGIRGNVEALFAQALTDPEEITTAFSAVGFRLLAHRPVRFECRCSRDRMLSHLVPIYQREGEALFDPGCETLEIRCEYCKSRYDYSRAELRNNSASGGKVH
jgi:molecular chaperone Hsp33